MIDPGIAADREAQRDAQAVALLADESQAADRHQEGAGAHHDRERRLLAHPEQAHEDHARRVEPDAEGHERAEREVAGDRDRQLHAADADLVAAGGEERRDSASA